MINVPELGFDVVATVTSQQGSCEFDYKVGDEVRFCGKTIEGTTCMGAMTCLVPAAYALKYGAAFPWETDKSRLIVACPDAGNPVVFELKRAQE